MCLPAKTQMTADVNRVLRDVVLPSTLPLLLSVGEQAHESIGNGTLFEAEGRHFVVTALHVIKQDENDLSGPEIEISDIAFPQSRSTNVGLWTLGKAHVWRPALRDVDVVVLELFDPAVIRMLRANWCFLTLDRVGNWAGFDRLLVAGSPRSLLTPTTGPNGLHISQRYLAIFTDELAPAPVVPVPAPNNWDRFLLLTDDGDLIGQMPDVYSLPPYTATTQQIPHLNGISGCAIWGYREPGEFMASLRDRLVVVGVECAAYKGHWIRGVHWDAVKDIMADPAFGLRNPPWPRPAAPATAS